MLVLLPLLRACAISRDACVAAFRESLVSRCQKQISFRPVMTSQVSPVPLCQCDPRADCRLMTPNHLQAAPISQPRTSLADQRIPSVCPSPFILYLLQDFPCKEFKISSMNSSEQHFEKALHRFCRLSYKHQLWSWLGREARAPNSAARHYTHFQCFPATEDRWERHCSTNQILTCTCHGSPTYSTSPQQVFTSCTRTLLSCTSFFLICCFCICSHY